MGRTLPGSPPRTGGRAPSSPGDRAPPAPPAPPSIADALHAAADGLAVATTDGRVLDANRAFCELFGLAQYEAIDLDLAALLDPRDAGHLVDRLPHLLSGQTRAFHRDCRIRRPTGLHAWCGLAVAVSRDAYGRPSGLVIQVRDITEAKQVEQMMLSSDRRFRAIFNALSEGFVETDTRGRVIDVNDPLCAMLGYGRHELIGRRLFRFLDEEGHAQVAEQMRAAAAGVLHRTLDLRLRTKAGGRIEAQVFSTTLTDTTGRLTGASAIVLDVTEHNRAQAALRASERRYRTLVDSIQDGLVLIRDGRYEYVNEPFARMLGTHPAQLIGRVMGDLVSQADRERLLRLHDAYLKGESAPTEVEVELRGLDGRRVAVNIHAAVAQDDTGHRHTIATVKDITERRRIEAELRKLSWAVEQSATSVFITDADGVIEYVNPRFTEMTGYTPAEVLGRTPAILASGETRAEVYADLWAALSRGREWKGELRNRRKDGTLCWEFTAISPMRDARGKVTQFVCVKEDVTGRKEADLLNWKRANFDQVTELPNRVLFKDRLLQALGRARREDTRLAVMFIDLDRFKAVNDTLGHEIGDLVLRQVGGRLVDCMRDTDTVARLGGDEFTAILPNPGPEEAITRVAARVLEALRRPFDVGDGQQAFIGGSIGIALFPNDADDADGLLKNADQAMYQAKETGRNTYQFFTPDMNAATEVRLKLEADLRKALRDGEFAVHFQPMVDAASRRIIGAEALVRWEHPERGLISPGAFLHAAEDIGLIGDLGAMVLSSACRHCQRWRQAGHPAMVISVNIAGRQVGAPDFLTIIDRALADSGLPAEALELEVSESLLMADLPLIDSHLNQVVERGVHLTIDDFGTGTSSLQHLRRFPFSTLKVDRSFVHDVLDNREDAILVEAVIAMARKLGLAVVAEGVESEDQIDFLLTQYCDMFQGFLFGHPLPADAFEKLLQGASGTKDPIAL